LCDRCSPGRDEFLRFVSKGANQIHVHIESDLMTRKAIERDLLAKHTEAYEPIGGNIKTGG